MKQDRFEELRRKAGKLLSMKNEPLGNELDSCTDVLELIQELRLHQAELEIQNEELQKAHSAIKQLYDEYNDLYENAPCGYVTLNDKGLITRNNAAARSLLGMTGANYTLSPLSISIDPGYENVYFAALRKASTGEPVKGLELKLRRDGEPVWVRADITADKDEDGMVQQWRLTLSDFTETKKVTGQLVEAKKAADGANRAKSEFLASMSHEIRTPINGVMGMLQLLQMTGLDVEQRGCVQDAVASCKRLNSLIGDILDISKIESGRLQIASQSFSLHEIVRSAGQFSVDPEQLQGLDLHVRYDPRLPERLWGDPVRVHQILDNLVGNAVKYTPGGGVTLEAWRISGFEERPVRVLFIVADTGPGIDDELLQRLFEPFVQGERQYRRSTQGVGLGLAITRRLVEFMRGSLCLETEVGKGSAFYVCLPFDKFVEEAGEHTEDVHDRTGESLKLLLAEDDLSNRRSTQLLLEKMGHQVTAVEDGHDALDALQREDFDCVLMDVRMPGLDGLQAVQRIRNDPEFQSKASTPVVAFTAFAMAGDRERFLHAGMDDYVAKPVDVEELARLLARVVRRSS